MQSFTYAFPRPSVTVDMVIFGVRESRLAILLVEREATPFPGYWTLPGGFVQIDESLEEAAQRILRKETGIEAAYLEQLYTYGKPDRDPRGRVITVAYFALVAADTVSSTPESRAKWHYANELPTLGFDHNEIVEYGLRRLRYKLEYSAVGFELLPTEFTLTELQTTYEIILGVQLDKRNFRRKILEAKIIEETHNTRFGEGRPARLYRYREDAVAEVKARRLFP